MIKVIKKLSSNRGKKIGLPSYNSALEKIFMIGGYSWENYLSLSAPE